MFELEDILQGMVKVLRVAHVGDTGGNEGELAPSAGSFFEGKYVDNQIFGAHYEIKLAVRKAHTQLSQGHAQAALDLLVNCRNRLPAKTDTKALDHLIAQLGEVQAQ